MFLLLDLVLAATRVSRAVDRYVDALDTVLQGDNGLLNHFRLRMLLMTWTLERANLSELTGELNTFTNAFKDKQWDFALLNFLIEEPGAGGPSKEQTVLGNFTTFNTTSSSTALGPVGLETLMKPNVSQSTNATLLMMSRWVNELRAFINKSSTKPMKNHVMVTGPFINGSLVSVIFHKPFVKFNVVPAVLCYQNTVTGNCGTGTMFLDVRFEAAGNRSVMFMLSKFDSSKDAFHRRAQQMVETLAHVNSTSLENKSTWIVWTGDFGMGLEKSVYDTIPMERRHNATHISSMQSSLDELKVHNESIFGTSGFYEPDPPVLVKPKLGAVSVANLSRPDCHYGGTRFKMMTNPQWRQRLLLKKGLSKPLDFSELEVLWKRIGFTVDAEYKPLMAKLYLRYRGLGRMIM